MPEDDALARLLRSLVCANAGRVVDSGVTVRAKASAWIIAADGEWELCVTISPRDGVPRLVLAAEGGPIVNPTPLAGRDREEERREVEACAIEAAPGPDEPGIPVKQLAARAGYANSGHFRDAVNALVDRGILVRGRRGIRRARSPVDSAPG